MDALRHLRVHGPTPAGPLRAALRLSPATFSRTMAALRAEVLVVGATRARVYAARREIPGLPRRLPVYELRAGGPVLYATLHPVAPAGHYVESSYPVRGFHPDLPWFLHDLRPSGFLGRLAPRLHPELGLPPDVRGWSGDQVLTWLHAWGLDTVGAFVVGDPAWTRLATHALPRVDASAAARGYEALADAVLAAGAPGSSAGGEQPKFLADREDGGRELTPVLVKFSPIRGEATSRRTADLLRCEAHAAAVLTEAGIPAARVRVLEGPTRTFLEVERFDRAGGGRLGLVSLLALGAHHGLDLRSWTASADGLLDAALIPAQTHARMVLLDRFGELVGNTDRHAGNLSFFFAEGRLGGLAPVYDMLPMAYGVQAGELRTRPLVPPVPSPRLPAAWREAWALALDFWDRVARDPTLDDPLREVAATNHGALLARRADLDRLPAG